MDYIPSIPTRKPVGNPKRKSSSATTQGKNKKNKKDFVLPSHITSKLEEIVSANDPESIAKYIAERRRSYPTASAILNKPVIDATPAPKVTEVKKEDRLIDCKWFLRNSCKSSSCRFRHDPVARERALKEVWSRPRKQGSLKLPKPEKCLLAKLLEKEIDAERDVVLACLGFIQATSFLTVDLPQQPEESVVIQPSIDLPIVVEEVDSEPEEGEIL